jgi:hypothetical protein
MFYLFRLAFVQTLHLPLALRVEHFSYSLALM